MRSGQTVKRISSWTSPWPSTPPPTARLAKPSCHIKKKSVRSTVPDSNPALFFSGFQEAKKFVFRCLFAYYIFLLLFTFTTVFKDNKSLKKKSKAVKIKAILNLSACWKYTDPARILTDPDAG
jgi:hypothetical protein